MPAHVKKGDEVMVTAGKYRGKKGEVVRVIPSAERVVVRGPEIDGIVKTMKPTQASPQGGQVQIDRSFHISNVSPLADGRPTRVRFEVKADGSKSRVAVRTGKVLSQLRGPADGSKAAAGSAGVKKKTTSKKTAKKGA
jgi:large subunit ribosomal protein L24